jgi:predicted GIY-YIG superfamily endonuclease
VYQNSRTFTSPRYPKAAYVFDRLEMRYRAESVVYLLHFDQPISPDHTCQHYLGWTNDLYQRLLDHAAGRGARLTQVALERGITWQLAFVWRGDRTWERTIKARKNAPRYCPICRQTNQVYILEQASAFCDIPF